MGIIKELRVFIAEEKAKNDYIKLLEGQIRILNKTNQDLLDRLMAVDFTKFKTYQGVGEQEATVTHPYDLLSDETLVGSVLEDETEPKESS